MKLVPGQLVLCDAGWRTCDDGRMRGFNVLNKPDSVSLIIAVIRTSKKWQLALVLTGDDQLLWCSHVYLHRVPT